MSLSRGGFYGVEVSGRAVVRHRRQKPRAERFSPRCGLSYIWTSVCLDSNPKITENMTLRSGRTEIASAPEAGGCRQVGVEGIRVAGAVGRDGVGVILVAMLSPVMLCSLKRLLKLRRSLVLLKRRIAPDGVVDEEVGEGEGRIVDWLWKAPLSRHWVPTVLLKMPASQALCW